MSAVTTPANTGTSTITAAAPTPTNSIYPSATPSVATTTSTVATPPVSTTPQNLLLTDTGAPTIITDTGATVDPLTMTATDLGQDTSGLLPNDWDVEPFAPSLFARTYYGSSMGIGCNSCSKNNEYTIMPFGPAYFARAGGGGFEVEPFRPNVYYAQGAGADIGAWFKTHLCPHVSQQPGKGAVNCYNLWLILGLGISLVVAGVALR